MRYKSNNRLKDFKSYLQNLGNRTATIHQKTNYTSYFLDWLKKERIPVYGARYNDLVCFIDYCNRQKISKAHVNRILAAIRNYYQFLKQSHPHIINPAINLHVKGTIKRITTNMINYQELEKLYQNYWVQTLRDKRNKVILGLLIYQGLTTEELHRLTPDHLKLKQGKIKIPGNRKRNSRVLDLKPFQILELNEYVNLIRPAINPPNNNQLLVSMQGNKNLKNTLHHLFRAIKIMHPDIGSSKQIRASVITHWLKSYNLRQVQYLAGHKYVGSTQKYRLNNLEELKNQVEKYHPLTQDY